MLSRPDALDKTSRASLSLPRVNLHWHFFFLNYTAPPEIYPLPLPSALPISLCRAPGVGAIADQMLPAMFAASTLRAAPATRERIRAMMADPPAAGVLGALGAMKDRPDSKIGRAHV